MPDASPLLGIADLDAAEAARLEASGIRTVAELDLAAATHRLQRDAGLSPERAAAVRGALLRGRGWGPERLLDAARRTASRVLDRLQRDPNALRLAVTGALRRMDPVLDQVDLLATAHETAGLIEAFTTLPDVAEVLERRPTRALVRLEDGFVVSLEVADEPDFAVRLLETTGPDGHVEALRRRAAGMGVDLHASGPLEEDDLYGRIELPWAPPERRRADAAPSGPLVTMRDVRGVAHLHTDEGHGAFPLADMVFRAEREGYRWVLVADRGIDAAAFARQRDAVDRLRLDEDVAIDVVLGVEVGIGPDGRLDGDPQVLEEAEVVLAEPPDGGDATADTLAALDGGRIDVLVRPTGRVLLGRPPRPLDIEAVLRRASQTEVAVGLSGLPQRLDLPEAWHGTARELGLLLLPTADAHDLNAVDQALLAVAHARRGGWPPEDVLTTFDVGPFRAWAARPRGT